MERLRDYFNQKGLTLVECGCIQQVFAIFLLDYVPSCNQSSHFFLLIPADRPFVSISMLH